MSSHTSSEGSHVPPVVLLIDHRGQSSFWIAFWIFVISSILFAGLSLRVAVRARLFYYIGALIAIIGAMNYYRMASREGYALVPQGIKTIDGVDSSIIRQVYSQHYTDWSLGTILTLFQLSLLSGMSWLHTALLLIATEGQIQTASIAALQGDHTRKMVWWGFSLLFTAYSIYNVSVHGRKAAHLQHTRVYILYSVVLFGTDLLLIAYPLNFLFGEGLGITSVGTEQVIYSILDIFVKTGFGLILAFVDLLTDHEYTLNILPESWVEPRSKTRALQLLVRHF
ncbi:family A G protein-coupled receptor-like protein [Sistotremastrum suecicum HHB10207 ss-3]|uniref:Family A G protein-coupled receptor-like protein n=1 Tax=Sistotremastrum suecicum HHB10207 ss-3 TaxID=1314776 RepID=A0A166G536_9AGAM|nr:family A G protein-coupled receptor-like protein [Sistotremastrum suecicum HHB10207 ss-3]